MVPNRLSRIILSAQSANVRAGIDGRQHALTASGSLRCYGPHRLRPCCSQAAPLRIVLALWLGLLCAGRASAQFDLAMLYQFGAQPGDGASPAGLTLGPDGAFYGGTVYGGANNDGTIYRFTTSGQLTTLYSFGASPTDGVGAWMPLTLGADGAFYGVTSNGGNSGVQPGGNGQGFGTIFKITTAGDYTQLYRFGSQTGDGERPNGLVQAKDGAFYGTTLFGGAYGTAASGGTIFKITPTGAYTLLYSFGAQPNDGTLPYAGLALGSDGALYGTTSQGGAYNKGAIFKITTAGAYTLLYSFGTQPNDGGSPLAALTPGPDGLLYGTSGAFGAYYNSGYGGTIFKITTSGALTTLYQFGSQPGDGVTPYAALTLGQDGAFYGTTAYGGLYAQGTVFRITPAGSYSQLYSFGQLSFNSAVTYYPLTLGPDGAFYGTAYAGGYYEGAIFRLSPATIQLLAIGPQFTPGGQNTTGYITLVNPAPAGGAAVTLSASNPAASVPASVMVQEGQTSASFPIATLPVDVTTPVIVTATYLDGSTSDIMQVQPASISGLTINPASVTAGTSAMATVTFAGPIPPPGLTVQITTDSKLVSAPATVLVGPSGTATFSISTQAVQYPTTVHVTATFNQNAITTPLTIQPAPVALAGISVAPTSFIGGQSEVGTVSINTLSANNVTLTLTSNSPMVQVPANVTVRSGAASANFVVRSQRVSKPTKVTITASDGHNMRSIDLMLMP
jgi:uncharacterized repeat protein (TIGR03803 family)